MGVTMRRAPVAALVGAVAVSLVGAVPAAAAWRIVAEPPLKPASPLVDGSAIADRETRHDALPSRTARSA